MLSSFKPHINNKTGMQISLLGDICSFRGAWFICISSLSLISWCNFIHTFKVKIQITIFTLSKEIVLAQKVYLVLQWNLRITEKQLCIFSSCNIDAFTGFLPMRHYRYKLQLLYVAIFTVAYYIRRSISVITLKRVRDYEQLSLTSCHRWLYLPLTHFNVFESIQRCSFVNNHSKLRIR